MRTIYLIRHAESTGTRYNRHLFPRGGAPLSNLGETQASSLHQIIKDLHIDFDQTVATSELIRTQQTAKLAGFKNLHIYPELNEIEHGLEKDEIEALISKKQLTPASLLAATKLLSNPPKETIWFTHGMLIASIAEKLGISKEQLFIPDMGTITKITLP